MANYNISGGFADTQDNLRYFIDKYSVSNPGPYIGIVKDTADPLRMGRLGVVIPALANIDGKNPHVGQVTWCQYLLPFYGATPFKAVSKTDPYSSRQNQTSYGMWAVPPDIDTNVLVIFAQGEKNKSNAFWIGCIQEPLTNHMVPGLGASKLSSLGVETTGSGEGGQEINKQKEYGTDFLPTLEKNKKMYSAGEGIGSMDQWKLQVK